MRKGYYTETIFFPKGIRETSTSLKCCFPQGMPMMVIKRMMPIIICTRAVYHPPNRIQIILQNVERQPVLLLSLITFCPKGQSTKLPTLKHCNPQGIPTIVMHKTRPPIKYPRAASSPPKRSHTKFPSKFMN